MKKLINLNVYMLQQIICVTSEKNASGDRMGMPRDHDQHRVGVLLIFKQSQEGRV